MRFSLLLLALSSAVVGCTDKGDTTDTDTDTAEEAVFDGIAVGVNTLELGVGESVQLSPVATYSDGSTQDISAAAEYRVVNGSVAEVSDNGVVTALAEGSTELEIGYQGFDITLDVEVSSAALFGIVSFAGIPVEGVEVSVDGGREVTLTNASGRYEFDSLAPGSYDVVAALPSADQDGSDSVDVTIDAGDSERADIALSDVGYPTGPDAYESNDLPGTAGRIAVGNWQFHTLWASPEDVVDGGDEDYFRVSVQAGVEYDIVVDGLCAICDTVLTLFEADGITPIDDNDDADFTTLGSQLTYTPEADGELVYRVEPFNLERGVAAYFTAVLVHVDVDDDGVSAFRDCDDAEPDISPVAVEVVDNGIDDDCLAGDASGTDANEPNDVRTQATPLPYLVGSPYVGLPFGQLPLVGALGENDEDWLSIVIPANSASGFSFFPAVTGPGFQLDLELFDADGETELDAFINDTDSPKTLYLRVSGSDVPQYIAYAVDFGQDEDGDGDYPRDIPEARDCAEGDPSRDSEDCQD